LEKVADSHHWFGRLSEALRDHESARLEPHLLPPRYEILGDPKAGGMGVVYRAWDRELGREVAIKVLLEKPESQAHAVARLRREAQLAARLSHPNIVAVHDAGTWKDSGKPYIVMQYIDGSSLGQAGISDLRELARVMAKVARAVGSVHERGVVHRDLKPQNILVDRKGHVYLTDFGLAQDSRTTSEETSTEVVGTPAFMAPEQAAGMSADARSDVYALGATLYALVTGKPPARGATPQETLADAIRGIPPPARKLRSECPERLERIITKSLSKRPEDRYATAVQLAEALEQFRRTNILTRHPWSFGAAGVLLLSGLAWSVQWRMEQQRAQERLALDEISTLMGLDEYEEARARIAVMRPILGEKDERLNNREEDLRRRLTQALQKESIQLFSHLWTGMEGVGPRSMMIHYAPREGEERAHSVEQAVKRFKALEGELRAFLRANDYGGAEQTFRKMEETPSAGVVLDSLKPALVRELKDRLGIPPEKPGDKPPAGIEEALAFLQALDKDAALIGEFRNALRLRNLFLDEHDLGHSSQRLTMALTKMTDIVPTSPYIAELEKEYILAKTRESESLELETRLNSWRDQGLRGFKQRSIVILSGALEQARGASESLPKKADPSVVQELQLAVDWLDRYVKIWAAASTAPEVARSQATNLSFGDLGPEWKEAAENNLGVLKVQIRQQVVRVWSGKLSEYLSLGDLSGATEALGRLEQESLLALDAVAALKRILDLKEALEALQQCRKDLERGNSEKALQAMERILGKMPRNAAARKILVDCFEHLAGKGEKKVCLEAYGRWTDQGVLDDADLRKTLAPALELLADRVDQPSEVWRASLKLLDRPSAVAGRLERVVLLRRLGRPKEALKIVDALEQENDPSIEVQYVRGQLRFLLGSYPDALEDFEKLAQADLDQTRFRFWCGVVKRRLKNSEGARLDLKVCIDRGFAKGESSLEMAKLFSEEGTFTEALDCLAEALAWADRLTVEERIARNAERDALEIAIRRFSREVRSEEADIYRKQENWDKCREACTALIDLDRTDPWGYLRRGFAAFKGGRLGEAKPDAMEAIRLFSLSGDTRQADEAKGLLRMITQGRGK
jgi:tetratricopeptide (TPR) repeat protein